MRAARKRNNTKYNDDDSDFEEFLLPVMESPTGRTKKEKEVESEGPPLVVEKILGRKFMEDSEMASGFSEMYLVKWRGQSYLHVSWEMKGDIERVDPQGKVKIKRFLQSPLPPLLFGDASKVKGGDDDDDDDLEEDDIEYFNPDYSEIHRIISCDTPNTPHSLCHSVNDLKSMAEDTDDTEYDVRYFVKWRGLPYSECSWEIWGDIKYYTDEVYAFWQRQRPPKLSAFSVKHPAIQDYSPLVKSPVFGIPEVEVDGSNDELKGEGGLTMRDYQLEGVNWLLWNWWHKRPCILADEMGLGKTIQSVCFLHQLRTMPTTKCSGPFLVVAPLSLISQWQSEIALWSPDMNCVVMHGSQQARDTILSYEFYHHEDFTPKADVTALRKQNACKFDILLTTYEICMKDIRIFTKINWKVLIVDEAHRLKNCQSRLFEVMMTIPRQQCVLLTGTPLQNKTEELWSLLHFADPVKFKNQDDFVQKFGDLRDAADVAKLHALLKPFLLRRVKEDVEKTLPPKEEVIVEVTLTSFQKQFYRAIYEKNVQYLFRGAKASNTPSLMNVMMELRKCCNHPYLIRGVEDRLIAEMASEDQTDAALHQKLVDCSGKFVLLDKLLPRLRDEGRKVLIFSQMVKVLNLLEDYLRFKGYLYERLDGSTRSTDRNMAVERFCRPSLKRFVMLLSTKAGGLGLNLTAADTVIIFDSDWNPHNDMQAQARAHRIGQTKAVKVYRLLTRKTYEMHMFHQASLKLGLDKAVLAHARNEQEAGDESSTASESNKLDLQAKEIDELLKRGAYDMFRDDDTEQTEFVEADIDAILSRQAHVVTTDHANSNSMSSSLGGFSKASFVSADETEDIDIDDPDFWKKAVGFEEPVQEEEVDPFIENLPNQRKRKQTQVFGENDMDERELEDLLRLQPIKKTPEKELMKQSKKEKEPKPPKEPKKKKEKPMKEPKEHKDPKTWGPHARDRMLRALLQYGFGRWKKIRTESGATHRELQDIEDFSRSYMLQCGLCAGMPGEEKGKSDTQFIADAINAAKQIQEMVQNGEAQMSTLIPSILQDAKLIHKLKGGGSRKMLSRLEQLTRLFGMVGEAVTAYCNAKNPDIDTDGDLDFVVAQINDSTGIAEYLPLGDVRPAWARPRTWWDEECDKQLIMGVFEHGHGKYSEIRDDSNFFFQDRLKAAAELAKTTVSSDSKGHDLIMKLVTNVLNMTPASKKKHTDVMNDDNLITTVLKISESKKCRVIISTVRLSQYRGVYSQPGSTKWMAQYGNNTKSSFIGSFDSEFDAAIAYDSVVKKLEGSDDGCNFASPISSTGDTTGEAVRRMSVMPFPRDESPPLPWHRASKYRGVRASGAKWTAQICYDGVNHHLGTFSGEYQAALAYDASALEHHGELAVFNFPAGIEKELSMIEGIEGVEVNYFDPTMEADADTDDDDMEDDVDEENGNVDMDVDGDTPSANSTNSPAKSDEKKLEISSSPIEENRSSKKVKIESPSAMSTHNELIENCDSRKVDSMNGCPRLKTTDLKKEADGGNAMESDGTVTSSSSPAAVCKSLSHESTKTSATPPVPTAGIDSPKMLKEKRDEVDNDNKNENRQDDEADEDLDDEDDDEDNKEKRGKREAALSMLTPEEDKLRTDMLMPEARLLNRLFSWLVTSDVARQSKADIEEQKRIMNEEKAAAKAALKQGSKKKIRKKKLEVEPEDDTGTPSPTDEEGTIDAVVTEKSGKKEPAIRAAKKRALSARKSKAGSASGAKSSGVVTLNEDDILVMHHDIFEHGSYNFPQKNTLMRKCEALLRKKHVPQLLSDSKPDLIEEMNASEVQVESSLNTTASLSAEEAKRLCSAFILYGAPFEESELPVYMVDICALLGTGPSHDVYYNKVSPLDPVPEEDSKLSVSCDDVERNVNDSPETNIEKADTSRVEITALENRDDKNLAATNDAGKTLNATLTPCMDSSLKRLPAIAWEKFLVLAGVQSSVHTVRDYYNDIWLPFCVKISSVTTFTNKKLLPEPSVDMSDHSHVTKNLCSLFMQRQRMLRTIRFVLSSFPAALKSYLRQNSGSYTIGMPVWWCPWIHDIALMVGCLQHGFMNIDEIIMDKNLPFSSENLKRHIYRVFIFGSRTQAPVAADVFSTADEAHRWVEAVALIFPLQRDLENRMAQMLSELTKHLPARHLHRIYNSYESVVASSTDTVKLAPTPAALALALSPSSTLASRNASTVTTSSEVKSDKIQKAAQIAAFDSSNGLTEWKIRLPLAPLAMYVRESAKRRRLSMLEVFQKPAVPQATVQAKKKYKRKGVTKAKADTESDATSKSIAPSAKSGRGAKRGKVVTKSDKITTIVTKEVCDEEGIAIQT